MNEIVLGALLGAFFGYVAAVVVVVFGFVPEVEGDALGIKWLLIGAVFGALDGKFHWFRNFRRMIRLWGR